VRVRFGVGAAVFCCGISLTLLGQSALARPEATVSSQPSFAACQRLATRKPTGLSVIYVGHLMNPHTIRISGHVPKISQCSKLGTRVVSVANVQVQQEPKKSAIGFGTGKQAWKAGSPRGLTLSSGNSAKSFAKTVRTALDLYCFKTASKKDGVNRARVVLQFKFRPKSRAHKATATALTKPVTYNLGYC
jgi:hypothetical protein